VPIPTEASPQVYRIASWATAGLAFVAAVLTFAFGLAAVMGPAPAGDGERVTTGPAPTGTEGGDALAADQASLTGTITRLVGTKVSEAPPLPLPLTLTVANRGGGTKAEFAGGAVAGKNATISWDGGRPLPLRGQGSLDLNGPIDVELNPTGGTWALDGGSRLLTPGSYTLGAPVAVNPLNGALGAPRESAKLDVPAGAAASVKTNGDVRTTTPAAALKLRGPGQLVLEGTLEVRTRDGVQAARKITFGPGAFELDLEPTAGGYTVGKAFLQGPMTVDG
jgi:hypothetical protein